MKKITLNRGHCVLSADFSKVERSQELWLEEREKKANVYQAMLEYIRFLEQQLEDESSIHTKYEIEQNLKKLRKNLKLYETQSILASAKFNLSPDEDLKEDSGPIKKLGTIFRKKD